MSVEKSVGVCNLYPLLQHIKDQCTSAADIEDITQAHKTMSSSVRANILTYIDKRYVYKGHRSIIDSIFLFLP